ncbi:hypothetical protein ACN263_30635 [Micromonospora sp. WMMD729]
MARPFDHATTQGVRHRVFCDRRLDGGRRCVLRADHETPCTARLPRRA